MADANLDLEDRDRDDDDGSVDVDYQFDDSGGVHSVDLMGKSPPGGPKPKPTTTSDAYSDDKGKFGHLSDVEFSFLDNKNVCCGICGEIVPFETLTSEHLPNSHAQILTPGYKSWLSRKLSNELMALKSSYKINSYDSAERVSKKSRAQLLREKYCPPRLISSVRVNPKEMNLDQLNVALREKMFEKLKRQVPVSLKDKLHAQCGLCQAIISINRRFEIVHLVRHFKCWHPTEHPCAGRWIKKSTATGNSDNSDDEQSAAAATTSNKPYYPSSGGAKKCPPPPALTTTTAKSRRRLKPLTMQDFAIIEISTLKNQNVDTLQCIWCGIFIETCSLAQHFAEFHFGEVEVPECHLCVQEMVVNAKFLDKYNMDVGATLPDEHHLKCGLCGKLFQIEPDLESHVLKKHLFENGSGRPLMDELTKQQQDGHDDQRARRGRASSAAVGDDDDELQRSIRRQNCYTNCQVDEELNAGQLFDAGRKTNVQTSRGEDDGLFDSDDAGSEYGGNNTRNRQVDEIGPEAFANSRMILGRKKRPKRQFIMPGLRQAVPTDSKFIEAVADCHWKCKLCHVDIYGAVISAAAIRHFKRTHPDTAEKVQFEVSKARLERISDGCMELLGGRAVECLICEQTFNLHIPYNLCRAIRHLKDRHAHLMPEYGGLASSAAALESMSPPIFKDPRRPVYSSGMPVLVADDGGLCSSADNNKGGDNALSGADDTAAAGGGRQRRFAKRLLSTNVVSVSTSSLSAGGGTGALDSLRVLVPRRRGRQQTGDDDDQLCSPPIMSVDVVHHASSSPSTDVVDLDYYGAEAQLFVGHELILAGSSTSSNRRDVLMREDDGITVVVQEIRDDDEDEDGEQPAGGHMLVGVLEDEEEERATKQFMMQPPILLHQDHQQNFGPGTSNNNNNSAAANVHAPGQEQTVFYVIEDVTDQSGNTVSTINLDNPILGHNLL